MPHPLYGPEVRMMLADNDALSMQAFCETIHPATVAETLEGEFAVEEVWRFLGTTDIKTQAAIFEYFPIEWQVKMVEGTGRQNMARLIEQMSHDDRVDLMRRLMPRVAEGLLRLVDEADRRDIATLVKFAENTAGALMTTDYAWLPEAITVGEALDRLRLQAPNSETIYYVYILAADRRLLGVVTLRDLILAPRHAIIRDVMEKDIVTVAANDDREKAAQEIARFDLLAIPVVDDDNHLVGIVTHDDVIDVVVQEATEDVQRLGGVAPIAGGYLEADFATVWRKRVIWLSLLFVAGSFTILALRGFQGSIEKFPALAFFIALCIGTGGNSGSQAATLITRALALNQLTLRDWFRVLRHELFMGLALGLTLGLIGFVIIFLLSHLVLYDGAVSPLLLSLVVSQAVVVICLWGTLVGSMLPIIFRTLGFDPAFASSPFVAIFVDVTGIVLYFSIAAMWIEGF